MNYCDILRQLWDCADLGIRDVKYLIEDIRLPSQIGRECPTCIKDSSFLHIQNKQERIRTITFSLWFQNYGNATPPSPVKEERVTASNRSYTPSFHSEEPARSDFRPCHRSKKDSNSSVQTTATKIYMLLSLFTTGRCVLSLSRIIRRWTQEKERQ